MLTLQRYAGERIVIIPPDCGPVRVTVIWVDGGKVRLGIEADSEVAIHREEVYQAIQRDGERRARRTAP